MKMNKEQLVKENQSLIRYLRMLEKFIATRKTLQARPPNDPIWKCIDSSNDDKAIM